MKTITVVGGGGHVGLPLSIALADASEEFNVNIYDINESVLQRIEQGHMPFMEDGAEEKLKRVIQRNLFTTSDPACLKNSDIIIVVLGTPVDEHLNPKFTEFNKHILELIPYLKEDQTLILRSTVFPGTSEKINHLLKKHNLKIHLAFCPERIAEGKAMTELYTLPQIISGFDAQAVETAKQVFGSLTDQLIELEPSEAELAKLFSNSWRYIQFATANQFYMLAQSLGSDFYKIHNAITFNYPRLQGFPRAGFAAGPCLFKDTMQLSALSGNQYFLGHAAMLINEELPHFVVSQLKKDGPLLDKTIGILGMAFKGESDDIRASLSFKLKKLLEFEAEQVLCADEYVQHECILPLEQVLDRADILILAAPHQHYKTIQTDKPIIDIWNWVQQKG